MRLIIGILALLPLLAAAETAYVTDILRLGLYVGEGATGERIRTLESGQSMEILSRDRNYANVRLPDNTEGWVKSAYLVDEKPAALIVAETMADRDSIARELEETKQAFAGPAATIDALKNDAADLNAKLVEAGARNDQLLEDNAKFQGLSEQYKGSLPINWVLAALAVCIVGGFLGGLWWVDRRSRARHGGIRIY